MRIKMKSNLDYFLIFVNVFIRLHIVSCQTYDDAVTLLRNRTFFYEKSIRPVTNQSSALVVNISFDLVSIQDFDEVQESLTVIGGLTLKWTDDFIQWSPSDYGGMVEMVSESGYFWTPDLILTNNVNKLDKVGESWQRIRFTNKGAAVVIQADVLSTLCKANVKYYPWDNHWCEFEFSSVAYYPNEMYLQPDSDKVALSYFVESGTWELIGSYAETRYQNATIMYRIHLARKPLFVLVNVVLPIIAMTFLNAAIFLIPAESGERVSYSITVLLAIAVFLTLIGEDLPKTSKPLPVFSFYLLTILMISIIITFANIFSLRLYHHDNSNPTEGVFATLTKCVSRIKNCKKNVKRVDSTNATSTAEIINGNGDTMKKNEKDVPDHSVKACGSCSNMTTNVSWKDVSVMFDKLCYIVFNILLSLAAFVFFMIVYTKEN